MKLTTMFNALRNETSEMLRIHDLNYQLEKKKKNNIGTKNA